VVMYYLGFRMGLYNTELLTRQSLDYSTVPGEVSIQGVYCNDLSGSIEFA